MEYFVPSQGLKFLGIVVIRDGDVTHLKAEFGSIGSHNGKDKPPSTLLFSLDELSDAIQQFEAITTSGGLSNEPSAIQAEGHLYSQKLYEARKALLASAELINNRSLRPDDFPLPINPRAAIDVFIEYMRCDESQKDAWRAELENEIRLANEDLDLRPQPQALKDLIKTKEGHDPRLLANQWLERPTLD